MDQPLTIPMTTGLFENVCFQLAVNGDTVCEQSELYSVSVTPMNPLDMVTGLAEVDITILDDGDCECVCVYCSIFTIIISLFSKTNQGNYVVLIVTQGYMCEAAS